MKSAAVDETDNNLSLQGMDWVGVDVISVAVQVCNVDACVCYIHTG